MPGSEDISDNDTQDRYIVPGLVRGLDILLAFSKSNQEMGISDIARAINTTRSTAFRLVYTLENLGFLQRVGSSKRYRIGSRVLDLGYSFLAGLDINELARPILDELRDNTHISAHLVIRDGTEVVYIARSNALRNFASTVGVGTRLPAHATAPGRVLLSALPSSEVVALYENLELQKFSETTPDSIGDLIHQLEKDRQQKTIISWGNFDPAVTAIAAPVRDQSKNVVAVISVSCPMGTYSRDEFESKVNQLVEQAASELSQALGYWGK